MKFWVKKSFLVNFIQLLCLTVSEDDSSSEYSSDSDDVNIRPRKRQISLWSNIHSPNKSPTTGTVCAQSCPTLCNPVDCIPPGSSVHGVFQQEYWSGLPCPTPGDLFNPGIEPASLISPALAGRFFTAETPEKPKLMNTFYKYILLINPGSHKLDSRAS